MEMVIFGLGSAGRFGMFLQVSAYPHSPSAFMSSASLSPRPRSPPAFPMSVSPLHAAKVMARTVASCRFMAGRFSNDRSTLSTHFVRGVTRRLGSVAVAADGDTGHQAQADH